MSHTPLSATPLLSIIVAVYNDWALLDQCLRSLAGQADGPGFEVIIVDDGSRERAPRSILDWNRCYPLTVIRQAHAGVADARNRGIRVSKGSVLVFVDADCRLQINCLAALEWAVHNRPQHNYFQLRLIGDGSTLVGRSEDLRLITLQENLLQGDGRIRYLNTAGFAIRRAKVDIEKGLFDPAVVRGEDTLLLVHLMQSGDLPFLAVEAVVQHFIPFNLLKCLLKEIRTACLERTYESAAPKGCRVRVSRLERLKMLWCMWKTAGHRSIGRPAWFVLVARQSLHRSIALACGCFRRRHHVI